MSPKVVLGLAALTLLSVLLAVVVVVMEPGTGRVELEGEPAFPALRATPDAVSRIVIKTRDEETVLERREDGGWAVTTADGYPGAGARVREIVTGLADMQLIEPKTSNPERFPRLEVEDLDRADAASRLVWLANDAGEALAEVLIGKVRNRLTGTEPAGTYIRRAGEEQAWLASGRIDLPEEPALWLERRVVYLQVDEVVRIAVEPPENPAYTLVRHGERWLVEGRDEELTDDADPNDLAGALEALEHQGVRPLGQITWPDDVWRLRFTTEDGLEVGLRLARIDGGSWAAIERATSASDATEAVAGRAAEVMSRTEGWAYRLPDEVAKELRRERSDWLGDETS